jgi:hypothetical protein
MIWGSYHKLNLAIFQLRSQEWTFAMNQADAGHAGTMHISVRDDVTSALTLNTAR